MTVYTKLLEAQKAVSGVAKSGRNESQKYDFVRAVDVVKEGKRVLNDVGLVVNLSISPSGAEPAFLSREGKSPAILYTVEGILTVVDPDDGSNVTVGVLGAGASYGDEKGVYKAITGAWKYGIRALLQIPDEKDDPENETENDREVGVLVKEREAATEIAKPAKPALATPAQRSLVRVRARDAGLGDDANFKTFVVAAVGKASSKELTQKDVEVLLSKLEDKDFVAEYATAQLVEA